METKGFVVGGSIPWDDVLEGPLGTMKSYYKWEPLGFSTELPGKSHNLF